MPIKISAALAIIVTAFIGLSPVAVHAQSVVSANLFGCPRDCGLFRATMHSGTPGTPDCRESCSWLPLLALFRAYGGCQLDDERDDPFNIKITAVDVPTSDYNTILDAANRWTNVITQGLSDVSTNGLRPITPECPYPRVVDDLFICIVYEDIDGPLGILGSALVDSWRTSNGLPIGGVFIVDSADIPLLKTDGSFATVFAHEIGHLLGQYKQLADTLLLASGFAHMLVVT
jgi:hypothetical protein